MTKFRVTTHEGVLLSSHMDFHCPASGFKHHRHLIALPVSGLNYVCERCGKTVLLDEYGRAYVHDPVIIEEVPW